MKHRLVIASMVMTIAVVAAACGLPGDGDFQPIDQSQDGFGLSETSSTTTSTTLAPTTTIDVTTSSTIGLTTTTIQAMELVTIFFPSGQQLTGIPQSLPLNAQLPQLMAWMQEGPTGEAARGVRLLLPKGEEFLPRATKSAGVVTVDFPEALFERFQEMDPLDQRLVFGQIVLTLCNRPGIGQVVFTVAGENMLVFRGDGTSPERGTPVSADDYMDLTGSPVATTTTTTATTTATTTPPEPSVVETTLEG